MSPKRLFFWFISKGLIPLTVGVILWTQSAGFAYFGAAAVGAVLGAKGLKLILRQPRPTIIQPQQLRAEVDDSTGKARPRVLERDYGMPSTHSSAVVCMAVYITLAAARLPLHSSLVVISERPRVEFMLRVVGSLMVDAWAMLIVMSRVWLAQHTVNQVAGGALFGAVFGLVSFGAYVGGLNKIGWALEGWWMGREVD